MAACSIKARLGINRLVTNIQRGTLNRDTAEAFLSGLPNDNRSDIEGITNFLYKTIQLNIKGGKKLLRIGDSNIEEDFKKLVEENPNDNYEENKNVLEHLFRVKNKKELSELIDKTINITTTSVDNIVDIFEDAFTSVETENNLEINTIVEQKIRLDISGAKLITMRNDRIKASEGIKKDSPYQWSIFLNTYFSGMNAISSEFREFVKKQFEGILLDTSEDGGFMSDPDAAINMVKNKINDLRNASKPLPIDENLNTLLVKDEDAKLKYFYDVFSTEFDFILNSVMVIVSSRVNEVAPNGYINFLTRNDGEEFKLNLFNIDNITEYVTKIEDSDNSFELNEKFNTEVLTFTGDSYAFEKKEGLEKLTIYNTLVDNNFFLIDGNGNKINISRKITYDYNRANNKNFSSIDHFVNPLDNGTAFINNLFPLLRFINRSGENITFGERLDRTDYLAIAPYLVSAGRSIEEFKNKLQDIIDSTDSDSRINKIADSLLTFIFRDTVQFINENYVHSLANTATFENSNENIINALYSALVSKDYIQYMKDEEGKLTVTKPLDSENKDFLINEELGGYITKKGYTKPSIASKLEVLTNKVDSDIKIISANKNINGLTLSGIKLRGENHTRILASTLGLQTLYNKIYDSYHNIYSSKNKADTKVVETFIKIVFIAAANKKSVNKSISVNISNFKEIFKNDNFIRIAPSMIFVGNDLSALANVFNVDTSKNVNVAGVKVPSLTTPNRDAHLDKTISKYKFSNDNINEEKITSNPFLNENSGLDAPILDAVYDSTIIKTAIIKEGKAIKISDWSLNTRIEYAMINGFLKGPKKIGTEFFLQPINYSDKSNIQMHKIIIENDNLLLKPGNNDFLIESYRLYQVARYNDLQKITINSLKEVIVSNFTKLYTEADSDIKKEKLIELRNMLLKKTYESSLDMTRPINDLLKVIGINSDSILFSDANLDQGADYINLDGNGKTLLLKPHLGIRAKKFSNKKEGTVEVKKHLKDHLKDLKSIKMNNKKVKKALSENKVNLTVEEFYNRFFLINGIYGHSLKVLTMGDESYFNAKNYEKGQSIDDYYNDIDSGKTTGLEQTGNMLVAQFKRAQSELSRGVLYASKDTMIGLKRNSKKNNILVHLDIYTEVINGDINTSYRFDNLEEYPIDGIPDSELFGKTLDELEGLGILKKFDNNALVLSDGNNFAVKINIGTDEVILNSITDDFSNIESLDNDLINSIKKLLIRSSKKKNSLNVFKDVDTLPKQLTSLVNEGALTLDSIIDFESEINENTSVTMPDFIPSITLEDPSSYINLLNSMNQYQENSDAVQFTHPLLELIMNMARGEQFGAFTSDASIAQKILTTTIEYDKARQILQKKSIQNPFTMEQMTKLGSLDLFNALDTLNKTVDFKQKNMMVPVGNNGEEIIYESKNFNNLAELFDHFGGYTRGDDSAWKDVLKVLKQNPKNMFSFVGLITLPSGQKTGHKKLNKYGDIFTGTRAKGNRLERGRKVNIDYTANEFNFEILSKDHSYDTTDKANKKSTLSLLSQLVNAVGFGGLSNLTTKNLQNAMASKMLINRKSIGVELGGIGRNLLIDMPDKRGLDAVIARLEDGDTSTIKIPNSGNNTPYQAYNENQMKFYDSIIRKGVYDMTQRAFEDGVDSNIIKQIIEGEGMSLSTPSIRSKVLGTIRSSFFKDTVKIKMPGFIGTVSATHRTINMFTLPNNGKRVGRGAYIRGMLKLSAGEDQGDGEVLLIDSAESLDRAKSLVLPFDNILVDNKTMKFGDLTEDIINESKIIKVVITPDVTYKFSVDNRIEFDALDRNVLIKVEGDGIYFKWYFESKYDSNTIDKLIADNKVIEDITEKFSLQWYQITKLDNGDGITDLKDTTAYRKYYSLIMEMDNLDPKIRENEIKIATTRLILETQKKDSEGNNIWDVKVPEVVLPTYFGNSFGIPKGESLDTIIGLDGNDLINATKYFTRKNISAKKFEKEPIKKNYKSFLIKKYSKKYLNNNDNFYIDILDILNNEESNIISSQRLGLINNKLSKAQKNHTENVAKDFVQMLETVLTRIPGQSKQSGFVGRIVEILDSQGNATFAPTEHLVNTGGDLDIDTLSVLTRSINKEGRMYKFQEFTDENGLNIDKVTTAYDKEISEVRISIKEIKKLHNKYNEQNIEKFNESLKIENDINKIDRLQNNLIKAKSSFITEEAEEAMLKRAIAKVHEKFENILSNAIFDGIHKSLSSADNIVEVNTPISMSMFKPLIKMLESRGLTGASTTMHGESYFANYSSEELAAQGKEAIGVFATVLKLNSAIQVSKISFDSYYKNRTKKDPFSFTSKLEYYDKIKKANVSYTRTTFADLDKFNIFTETSNNQELQNILEDINKGNKIKDKDASKILVDVLLDELNKLKNNENIEGNFDELVKDKIKSLFNIDMELSNNMIDEFKTLIDNNEELLITAFSEVIGSQLSNDVQSQFLSAATDNAKELILGKIRSNALTNSLITTMMILGYDTQAIIHFLYDPDIEKVLLHYFTKRADLDIGRMKIDDILKIPLIHKGKSSIKTLAHILEVDEEVSKYRAIRSLNEDFKIESFKLDKILDDLDYEKLYIAIRTDNINIIPTNKKEVFNANIFVFLHPQTRALFINLYESEKSKIPAIFKDSRVVSEFTGKSKSSNSYKNTLSLLSKLKVSRFLSNKVNDNYISGKVAINKGTSVNIINVKLNTRRNRDKFISNFDNYFNDIISKLKGLGYTNTALDFMGFSKVYNAKSLVLSIPKIKNADTDPITMGQIIDGINQLRMITGNNTVDALTKELYRNLSLYALIVSSGEIRKGSMTEMFEEINIDMAKFLETLDPLDYLNMLPVTDAGKAITLDKVSFNTELIKEYESNLNIEGRDIVTEDVVDTRINENERPDDITFTEYEKYSKNVKNVTMTEGAYINNIFKFNDEHLSGQLFYGNEQNQPAYRIFDSAGIETLPNSELELTESIGLIDIKLNQDLAKLGKQIGFSAKYGGKNIRILAYSGSEYDQNNEIYDEYLISHPDGVMVVAGAHLMNQNPELFLLNNIISDVNSNNNADYELIWNNLKNRLHIIPNILKDKNQKLNTLPYIVENFSNRDIRDKETIIGSESMVLGQGYHKVSSILIPEGSFVDNTINVYKELTEDDKFPKASSGSRSVLIPAFEIEIFQDKIIDKEKEIFAIKEQLGDILNSLNDTESVEFYGLNKNLNYEVQGFRVLGGINILLDVLKKIKGETSYIGYDVKIIRSQTSELSKVIITKKSTLDVKFIAVDNTFRGIKISKNPTTGKRTVFKGKMNEKEFTQAALHASTKEFVDFPHKNIPFKFKDFSVKLKVYNNGVDIYANYKNAYYKIEQDTVYSLKISEENKTISVTDIEMRAIKNKIKKDISRKINKSC